MTVYSPYGKHLPMFPTLYSLPDYPLTDERVEREVERLVDRADKAFLAGKATQEQYDLWSIALTRWARQQHTFQRLCASDVSLELVAL